MVSVFPDLLVFSLLAPFVLRVGASVLFIKFATFHGRYARMRHSSAPHDEALQVHEVVSGWSGFLVWCLCALEVLVAFFLFIGLFVQLAALFGLLVVVLLWYVRKRAPHLQTHSRAVYFLLACICLSLLLSGAGRPGFDLPL